ncbi:peptidase S28 family protein [Cavenderia fasciculata]|uniref:Peptidase S28 family protein n=1 Tax=Cavenderia fasciculata TaxID=261658 RepID=F4Q362_CACFS|nr:peptidase S28 family protein [Cavenderia fasciculata]EGG16784.1 peptidase S28 family protein [Cavenderia fasciculata]|eukprot:XP_004355258.1 peptidase S28 family protein [Cavenderia fasciculata]
MRLLLFVLLTIVVSIVSSKEQLYQKIKSPYPYYSEKNKNREFKGVEENDPSPPPFSEYYYIQKLDHFNFQTQQTFPQRYLISDTYWNKPSSNDSQCNGPILFYTGNEGDIVWFYQNSQFITNVLAQELGALLFFAEHRYYGQTLPFGNESTVPENLQYCTSEQALADYATIIPQVLEDLGGLNCPVISVGGSYGGMLASWMRMKYPNIVDGALAASAPILYFLGTGADPEGFNEIATNDFAQTSADGSCATRIRGAFTEISEIAEKPNGDELLSEMFSLCGVQSVDDLVNWIESGLTYMAMADYPYPAAFLEPMPGWPINASCAAMEPVQDDIQALLQVLHIYYNSSGQAGSCYNVSVFTTGALGSDVWDYQACTEMVMPMSSNGVQDMFPASSFDLDSLITSCQQQWGVTPDPYWITNYYGGSQNVQSSNIVFSNGILDPWRAGGVIENGNEIYAVLIDGGAHHLDLRMPSPQDPQSVINARALETQLITKWSNQASILKSKKN